MKIRKGELVVNEICSIKPEAFIEQVMKPFEYQVKSRNMKVIIQKINHGCVSIKTDWRLYQLIIFNLIQNAVKYNRRDGAINISTELIDLGENVPNEMYFDTIISDDGVGIDKERIPYLFEVFGELKHSMENLNHELIKDNGIGVGLSCSKIIANAIGGDVFFLATQKT
jgi:signal transduction histidine kinase